VVGNGDCPIFETEFKFFDRLRAKRALLGEICKGRRIFHGGFGVLLDNCQVDGLFRGFLGGFSSYPVGRCLASNQGHVPGFFLMFLESFAFAEISLLPNKIRVKNDI
jgi:hypothetical protein